MKATAAVQNGTISRLAVSLLIISPLIFASLTGCMPVKTLFVENQKCETTIPEEGGTRLFMFLNLERPDGPPVILTIDNFELLIDDAWVTIAEQPKEIDAGKIGDGQIFLGRRMITGTRGNKVRLHISAARMVDDGVTQNLEILIPDQTIEISRPLVFSPDSSQVLILNLDVEKSLLGPALGDLALTVATGSEARITSNLAYVSCPDEETVFVIRLDKKRIVSAINVTGNPTRMAVDEVNKKLIVLSSEEASVKIIDLSSNDLEKTINIPLIRQGNEMAVSNDLESVFVVDNDEIITKIDLLSGNLVTRNRIGNKLSYIYFMNNNKRLAVSSVVDKKVYLINPENLEVEASISVATAPTGLLEWQNYLYIAEPDNNNISIYDMNIRSLVKTVGVGFGPIRIASSADNVYVSNAYDGIISVLRGGQYSVIKNILVGKSAREMVVDEKQSLLLATEDTCEGSVVFIDTTANQVLGRVEIGAKPSGLTIVR